MTPFDFLNRLRDEEIARVLDRHPDLFLGKDLLEIGSGTGTQLRRLAQVCRSTVGIEIAGSGYASNRLVEIQEYDGYRIPFPDSSFDVVFSSNVMEHIKDQATIQKEIGRVLRPSGAAVHIVPTATWRLWTSIAHYPDTVKTLFTRMIGREPVGSNDDAVGNPDGVLRRWRTRFLNRLVPARHGEFGNRLTEYFLFRTGAWRSRFQSHGWCVEATEPLGLAYSGYSLLAGRLSMIARQRLARIIGPSTVLFVLRRARHCDEEATANHRIAS